MTEDEKWLSACGYVADQPDAYRRKLGSAYLVSAARAITCEHVVREFSEVVLFFQGWQRKAIVEKRSVENDCAVLRLLDSPPPVHVEPLRLADFEAKPETRWRARGYPDAAEFPAQGLGPLPFTPGGVVRTFLAVGSEGQRALQLYCEEMATGDSVKGISGAPVVINADDGTVRVIGHVMEEIPGQKDRESRLGTLFACPAEAIRRLLEDTSPTTAQSRLSPHPYTSIVEDIIEAFRNEPEQWIQLTAFPDSSQTGILTDVTHHIEREGYRVYKLDGIVSVDDFWPHVATRIGLPHNLNQWAILSSMERLSRETQAFFILEHGDWILRRENKSATNINTWYRILYQIFKISRGLLFTIRPLQRTIRARKGLEGLDAELLPMEERLSSRYLIISEEAWRDYIQRRRANPADKLARLSEKSINRIIKGVGRHHGFLVAALKDLGSTKRGALFGTHGEAVADGICRECSNEEWRVLLEPNGKHESEGEKCLNDLINGGVLYRSAGRRHVRHHSTAILTLFKTYAGKHVPT